MAVLHGSDDMLWLNNLYHSAIIYILRDALVAFILKTLLQK